MSLRPALIALGLFSLFLVSSGALGTNAPLPLFENVAADDGCEPLCDVDFDCVPMCEAETCRPVCSVGTVLDHIEGICRPLC